LRQLALEVTATGLVGFGLAETNGMEGADIVYYQVASNTIIDSFATKYGKPTADICQDWQLVSAEQSGGNLAVEMTRRLVSDDTQDRNITDDSAVPLKPTTVIAAWGDTTEIDYHCNTCKVATTVRFFGTGEASDTMSGLRTDENIEAHDLHVGNHAMSAQETHYVEFCFDVQAELGRNDLNMEYKHIKKRRVLMKRVYAIRHPIRKMCISPEICN